MSRSCGEKLLIRNGGQRVRPGRERVLVLTDCQVLDGFGGPPVEGEVWIAEGRIVAPHSVLRGATVSLRGMMVAPGLVDAHVHLCFDGSRDPLGSYLAETRNDLVQAMAGRAWRTVLAGVTTVRDLGCPTEAILALRDGIASGRYMGPRILASGAPLTTIGGHMDYFGGAVSGPDQIPQIVATLKAAGVDVVKVIGTGGELTAYSDPLSCQFSDQELALIVREGAAHGYAVSCHAHADAGIRQAVEAGVATVEHGSFASDTTLEAMRRKGVSLVPTLSPHTFLVANAADVPGADVKIRGGEGRLATARRAVQMEVRLLAGTDAGAPFTPHGNVATEVMALVEAGLSPVQALAAAGRQAAEVLGLSDIGTLIPGSYADLIVLEGNPYNDVVFLGRPVGVMKGGAWVVPPPA